MVEPCPDIQSVGVSAVKTHIMKTLFRTKKWENEYRIGYDEYVFVGWIGNKKGFTNRFFSSLIPFTNGKMAWHFMGFRFLKCSNYVSKSCYEINGWYTEEKELVHRLRKKFK